MKKSRKSFSTRGFVSLLMAFSFAGLALSGIVMYFAPPCSIADATGWTILAMTKTQWASLHQVSALVILVLAVIHLFVYNWNSFMCYFRQRGSHRRKLEKSTETMSGFARIRISKEVFASVLVAIVLYLGALTLMTPFGWLHAGSDAIQDYYRQEFPERTGRGTGAGNSDGIERSDHEGTGVGNNSPEGRGESGEGEGRQDGSSEGRGEGGGQSEGRDSPEDKDEDGEDNENCRDRGGTGRGQGEGRQDGSGSGRSRS